MGDFHGEWWDFLMWFREINVWDLLLRYLWTGVLKVFYKMISMLNLANASEPEIIFSLLSLFFFGKTSLEECCNYILISLTYTVFLQLTLIQLLWPCSFYKVNLTVSLAKQFDKFIRNEVGISGYFFSTSSLSFLHKSL